jgi:hypothetical protein
MTDAKQNSANNYTTQTAYYTHTFIKQTNIMRHAYDATTKYRVVWM